MRAVVVRHGGVVVSGVVDTERATQSARHRSDTDPHADHDTDDTGSCQHSGMATEDLASSIGLTCASLLTVALLALCVFG